MSHRFRVWFASGSSRDVFANSFEGASRTAAKAQRLVGFRRADCKPVRSVDLGHAGSGSKRCPICADRVAILDRAEEVR